MSPGRLRALPVLAALMVSFPFAAPAEGIYTWTDEQGVVHFSDRAPQQHEARELEAVTPVLVPMGDNLEAADRIAETVSAGQSREPSGKARSRSRDRGQQQRCDRYRQQLKSIQSRLRAGYSNTEGNRLRERRRTLNGRLSRECILR